MTFAIFGLESQYVFSPILRWFEKATSIWTDDQECSCTQADRKDNENLHFTLKCVQMVAKKKFQLFKSDTKRIGRKKERVPKISDALQAPEHVMLNFCSY